MSLVTLSIAGPIARLTLNRPDARNALSTELLGTLHNRLDELAARFGPDSAHTGEGPHVLVLTGEGRSFCAGMDLKAVVGNEALSRRLLHSLAEATWKLRRLPCVTVAVVNGAAIGGGCGLVTVCDLAITFGANKMGFPEVDLGVCPAVVAPWLVRKIGAGRARRVLLTGGLMSGKDAYDLGIVSSIVEDAERLPAAAEELIARLAGGSGIALRVTKALLNDIDGSEDWDVLERAAGISADILNTPETQAALAGKGFGKQPA